MKALVWHAARDLRLEDVPDPPAPGIGEAVVAVSYCGICGTDLHEYLRGPVMIRPSSHPLTGKSPPLALGHEFSGTVWAVGPDVTDIELGTRVTVDPCWRCGRCRWCIRGEYHICRYGGSVGLASDGGLAEFVTVPAAGLVPLPPELDDRMAALAEPLAVGLHAVRQGSLTAGEQILIHGAGPVGAAVLLAARAGGAGKILVSEPNPTRAQLALQLGASEVFDPSVVDVRKESYLRTGRIGPDVVYECTGSPGLVGSAVETARRGGRIVLVGIGATAAEIDPQKLVLYERRLIGSLGYQHDLPKVIELMAAGLIAPGPLVTDVVPLAEAVEGAFDVLAAKGTTAMKVLVDVSGGRPLDGRAP